MLRLPTTATAGSAAGPAGFPLIVLGPPSSAPWCHATATDPPRRAVAGYRLGYCWSGRRPDTDGGEARGAREPFPPATRRPGGEGGGGRRPGGRRGGRAGPRGRWRLGG